MNAISVKAYPLEKFDFYNWDTEITRFATSGFESFGSTNKRYWISLIA